MLGIIFKKWSNLILTIIVILLAGVILLLSVQKETTKTIIKKSIEYMPIFLPENIKMDVADKIVELVIITKNNTKIIPKEIVKEIVRYVPNDIIRSATAGLPDNVIDESKCKRIVKDDKFKHSNSNGNSTEITAPSELPWDDKINYCDSDNLDVEDVDLDQFIFAASKRKSKIFLY